MNTEKLLSIAAVGLLTTLGLQLAHHYREQPGPRHMALWRNHPNSVEEAAQLSQQIVQGRVTEVRRADDLVGVAPGEPGEVDRIPMEIVKIAVDRSYKGSAPNSLEIMHTGSTDLAIPATQPEPNETPPPRPTGGQERPAGFIDRSHDKESRLFVLDDDPPYRAGERYVLFLRDGPRLTVQGANVDTKTIVAPEGRFQVQGNNRLVPATFRGFAGQLRDKLLQDLESKIPR